MARRQINTDELHALYMLIGKGIWHLQDVEDALHTCITIKRDIKVRGSVAAVQAKAILSKHRTNTLGSSLRISRKAQVLSSSLQERLERFKEERDWLVHRLVHQDGENLYAYEKRFSLMARIKAFSEEALVLQKLIAAELEEFCGGAAR